MAFSLSRLVPRLAERLGGPLPGHEAHLRMAPQNPSRRADLSVEARDCRDAGVLLLLHPDEADPSVVLTVRRDHLPDHAGQISFPGGRRERGESLSDTALREAEEEINLPPASVDVLGALTPLFIPPSNFCVHPFVGHTPSPRPSAPPTRRSDGFCRFPSRVSWIRPPARPRRAPSTGGTWTCRTTTWPAILSGGPPP